MKYLLTLLLCLATTTFLAQEEKNKKEEGIIIKDLDEDTSEVAFAVIENVPIYYGCNEKLSNAELKECMSNKISKHVANNFNTNLALSLGLPDGYVRILVNFKINKEGKIVDIRARAPHEALESEAIRVIGLLPNMDKPGYQKGKPVIVPYTLPIMFKVDNSSKKLSKKERRRLRRQNKN